MSIGSIASTIWAQTTRSPATIDTAWGSSSSASPVASASTQRGSTAGQTGLVDPLAAGIQALLVQAQGGTGVTATTAIDPQSIMNHLQGTQTASTEQTGATGHAHGHHHHENTDTDASAATEASAATGSSGATVSLPTLTA